MPSLGESMYYVSFLDDSSRNKWVYFLLKKPKVFSKFKEFKVLVLNQIRKKINMLSIESGGKFHGNEFEEFLNKAKIIRQKITPYTP